MRIITLMVSLFITAPMIAENIEASGVVTYKMPNGKLVDRQMSMSVPARGKGELTVSSADKTIVAKTFFTRENLDKTTFYVIFDDYPGSRPDSQAVFTGSYMRGSNKAIYYGDIYIIKGKDFSADAVTKALSGAGQSKESNAKYLGGFMFDSPVE